MERRIGFIGAGKMAEALAAGIVAAGLAEPEWIMASDLSDSRREILAERIGAKTSKNNRDVVRFARTLIIALPPQYARGVLQEIQPDVTTEHLVVSIMAGVPLATIEAVLPGVPVVRVMPNTACLVGASASAFSLGTQANDVHEQRVMEIFGAVGYAARVEERLMDAVTGLSGSGPAYAFAVIEALADGGVAEGLPRETAIALAAQTLLGAGKMVLESGDHPAVLRDRVTSPAGTTAEGLAVLEAHRVRSAFAQAVRSASMRSRTLAKGEA